MTHRESLCCWERLKARGKGDDRGWVSWMASLPQWTWVWVNPGSWWWTGRPGMLQSKGSQRVRHDWVIEQRDGGPIPRLGRYPGEENGSHSSILAWRIPWMEELGELQSTGRKESDTTERLNFTLVLRNLLTLVSGTQTRVPFTKWIPGILRLFLFSGSYPSLSSFFTCLYWSVLTKDL